MNAVQKHRKKNIDTKKYYCQPCDKLFGDAYSYIQHQDCIKHNPSRRVLYSSKNIKTPQCRICGDDYNLLNIPTDENITLCNFCYSVQVCL